MDENTQKIALVTGASRGLGAAMAECLGARGWHVIAVARTAGGLEELDDRIRAEGGPAATLAPMDVNEAAAMMQLAAAMAQQASQPPAPAQAAPAAADGADTALDEAATATDEAAAENTGDLPTTQ